MQSKLWRRLWHLVGGSLFPILALFIPKGALLITLGAMTGIFVVWEIVRFALPQVNRWMISHLKVVLKKVSPVVGTHLGHHVLAVSVLPVWRSE